MLSEEKQKTLSKRFRGFLPVVVDVETGGLNPKTDALLEIAAVLLTMDENGMIQRGETISCHVVPFPNANLDPKALEVNHIKPYHPFRFAVEEKEALQIILEPIHKAVKEANCERAVLVGHNPTFDLTFLHAAIKRCAVKNSPFHRFTTFDTATLGGVALGQTVLARAARAAGLKFDTKEAHSAIYDAEITADLFCYIVNNWHK